MCTFKPSEIPTLQHRLGNPKVFGGILRAPISGDSEGEIRIWNTSIGLAPIDWGMDLKANVEELPGNKIRP